MPGVVKATLYSLVPGVCLSLSHSVALLALSRDCH